MVSEIILPIGRTLAYDSAIVSHSTIAPGTHSGQWWFRINIALYSIYNPSPSLRYLLQIKCENHTNCIRLEAPHENEHKCVSTERPVLGIT